MFPNRAARHSRATLQAYIVSQQFCATPSGNTLPLFRRWRVRIEAVLNKPGDSFSTLGRRFKPTSFHNRAARHFRATYSLKVFPNRAARHSRATLQPLNVPQQCRATPSGDTLPLFRRRNVRINPVMNKPGDTFGTLGHISRPHRSPTVPRDTLERHFASFPSPKRPHRSRLEYARRHLRHPLGNDTSPHRDPNRTALHLRATLLCPERVVVGDGAAGCNCSPKKG